MSMTPEQIAERRWRKRVTLDLGLTPRRLTVLQRDLLRNLAIIRRDIDEHENARTKAGKVACVQAVKAFGLALDRLKASRRQHRRYERQ